MGKIFVLNCERFIVENQNLYKLEKIGKTLVFIDNFLKIIFINMKNLLMIFIVTKKTLLK